MSLRSQLRRAQSLVSKRPTAVVSSAVDERAALPVPLTQTHVNPPARLPPPGGRLVRALTQ